MAIAEKYYDERGRSPMPIASTLDEIGRPAWIVLMILGFMTFTFTLILHSTAVAVRRKP